MPNSNPEQDPIETRIAMLKADIENKLDDRLILVGLVTTADVIIRQSIEGLAELLMNKDQQELEQTHPEQTTNTA
jgi:hypothetical protein